MATSTAVRSLANALPTQRSSSRVSRKSVVMAAMPAQKPQSAAKALGHSFMAAAVAASLLMAPAPAQAVFSYGRKDLVAQEEAAYQDVLSKLDIAIAESEKLAAASGKAASQAASKVQSATSEVAKAT